MATNRRYSGKKQLNKKLVIGGIALACLLTVFLIITFSIHIKVEPVGGTEPLELVYGRDTYTEEGAVASSNGARLPVDISGTVDMNRLGTYTITYTARYLWVSKSVSREVTVVDRTAPVIELKTEPNYFPQPGDEYQEEGYTATDDYDGDLTKFVQSRREGDTIIYTVTDSSGNTATVERSVFRQDLNPPVITLKGGDTYTINAGTAYQEPGFTAIDDRDGDITAKVTVTGTVNTYKAGTYKVSYTGTDRFGNTATVERTVIVKPIPQPPTVTPGGKVIYLTFDDGPGPYTMELLALLEKYNAKATFFVCNTGYKMDTILNAIVDGGHGIGVHSESHRYEKIYANEEAFFKDIYQIQTIIKNYTGVTTTLLRFPGGSANSISILYNEGIMTRLTQAVQDQGFQYFDWHVLSGDAGETKDTQQIVQNVINGIGDRNYRVVLQHDIYSYSVDAVEQILIWGRQNGYTFQALNSSSPTCHFKVVN